MRNGIVYNSGRERVRAKPIPRLFEPIGHHPCRYASGVIFTGTHPIRDAHACKKCLEVKSTSLMWTADLCAQCHERKEKGKSCQSVAPSASAPDGRHTSKSTTLPTTGESTTNSTSSTKSPSSPLASDPTSAGWVLRPELGVKERYEKGSQCIWHNDAGWWRCGWGECGGSKAASDWQSIDALLFPAREFAIGDRVECLTDEEFINELGSGEAPHRRAQVGKSEIIRGFETCGLNRQFHAVTWEGQLRWMWPVRALRLVKAGKDQSK